MQSSPPEDARLGVGRAVRRHLAIVIGLLVLLPAAAGFLVLGRASTYTSSTTVFLRPTIGNALSPDSAKNAQQVTVAMQTEAGLVSAPQVAALVSKRLGVPVSAGSAAVNATVPPNTQILQIRYTASSAGDATKGTQAYGESFLQERKAVSDDTIKRQLQLLKEQASVVNQNLKKVSANAASTSPSPDSAALVQLYTNRLTNLQDLIGQLETTDTNPGSVVTPATTPAGRGGLDAILVLGAAAVLGLLIGASIAVWRERGDDRVRGSEDELVGGVPILARLPGVRASDEDGRQRQRLELSNGYRRARAAMLIALPKRAVVTVAAADGTPEVPVGVIAANLAACLAGGRYRVCVLDVAGAASGSPSGAAEVLGVSPVPTGLAVAEGGPALDAIPQAHGVGLVTLEQMPKGDAGLFVSSRFIELVSGLQSRYDIVVIASPPLRSAQGTEISLVADGVLLVVTDRRTVRHGVAELVTQQGRLRVPVIGLLLAESGSRRGRGRAGSYDALGAEPTGTGADHADQAALEPAAADEVPAAADEVPAAADEVPAAEYGVPVAGLRVPDGPAADRIAVAERVPADGPVPDGIDDPTVILQRAAVAGATRQRPATGNGNGAAAPRSQQNGRGALRTRGPNWFDHPDNG